MTLVGWLFLPALLVLLLVYALIVLLDALAEFALNFVEFFRLDL